MATRTALEAPSRVPGAARRLRSRLDRADIRLDGHRPWDVTVHDERLYVRILRHGLTGAGDAYVDGWWDCPAIDAFFDRALRADLAAELRFAPANVLTVLRHRLLDLQSRRRAPANGMAHYDRGNPLFAAMLDPTMTYSCGYWSGGAETLEEAQIAKLDLVCRKLGLERGQRVLDIGCGWGGFLKRAAERCDVSGLGVTVSPAQAEVARARNAGLPVEIRVEDYRAIEGQFDRIASIGMFEHVGPKHHRTFMRTVDRLLAPEGLVLLHFFAAPRSFPNLRDGEVDWFERNIFPGMVIPSLKQVGAAIDGLFVVEDLHNFGADYDPTLMAWHRNFEQAWPQLRATCGDDDRFRRLWRYYLLGAAGAFRSRKYQVWQIVLAKRGVAGGYRSVR